MVQLASKGTEIGAIIAQQLNAREPFDTFSFRRLLRDIEQLPTYEERYHRLGQLYGVQQDVEKLVEYFEKALNLTSESVVKLNYYVALTHNVKHFEAYNVLINAAKSSRDPRVLEEAICCSILNLNVSDFDMCIEKYEKLQSDTQDVSNRVLHTQLEAKTMKSFIEQGLVSTEQLKMLNDIAWKQVEKFSFREVDCITSHGAERSYLTLDFRIFDSQATSEDIFEMNMSLIDKLIESQLDEIPVVIQFVRSELRPDTITGATE